VRDLKLFTPSQPASTAAKPSGFVFEVAERISMVVAGNRNEVTIQLRPENLGRMKVVAESGTAGLIARITTELGSVKQLLENSLPHSSRPCRTRD